jgi:glyoxylate utilization-related uncharacterized protein
MKYIAFSFFISILFFCGSTQQKEDLKIEIINTDISTRGNIESKNIRNVTRFDDYIYDSIPVNKINLKITNLGTKTYVFFIKKELDKVENLDTENIKLTAFKEEEIFEPIYLGYAAQLTRKGFEVRKFQNEIESDSLKQELNEKYLKEKIDNDKIRFQREMNYVVIHPGETKFFSYYKTLPIFLEHVDSYYMYKFNVNENYYFQLCLKNDAQSLKKNITVNQLKEIEENGYTIFEGTVKSNKVPIKFINFPR